MVNTFTDEAVCRQHETFFLQCHFWQYPFGDGFYMSRKGRTRGGGWVHRQVKKSMAMSRLSYKMALVGTGWPISLLCMNGLRKLALTIEG